MQEGLERLMPQPPYKTSPGRRCPSVRRRTVDPDNFQFERSPDDLGFELAIEFMPWP
jgi:hypothetical protein